MQRGSAALFILLAVFILGGSVIGLLLLQDSLHGPSVSPLPSQQVGLLPSVKSAEANGDANTQRYQDSDLHFEFEYPAGQFAVKPDNEDDYNKRNNGNFRKNFAGYVGYQPADFVKALNVASNTGGSVDEAPFTIWVFDNPSNLDAGGWFNKYWYFPFNWGQFEIAEKAKLAPGNEATIAGQFVNYGTISYAAGSPSFYYIPKDGKMYLIKILSGDVGQKILSSLRWGN